MDQTNQSYHFNASRALFLLLQEQTDAIRTSRYDAFIYLLENVALEPRTAIVFGTRIPLSKGQLVTSYSELAGKWNWHRSYVSQFLSSLEEIHVLTQERYGKATVITLPITDTQPTRLLTEEERMWQRFIFGATAFEEFAEMFDTAMRQEEAGLDEAVQHNPDNGGTGRRLHRLFNHLMLNTTKAFPKDERVAEALRYLYVEECGADLTQLLALLSFGGLKVIREDGEDGHTVFPVFISERASEQLAVVIGYYSPFINDASTVKTTHTVAGHSLFPGKT